MDDLLKPVRTAYKADNEEELHLTEVSEPPPKVRTLQPTVQPPTRPEEALEVLKSEPEFSSLAIVLQYLVQSTDIDLQLPSPLGSQIVNALVSDVAPHYWNLLSKETKGRGGWSHGSQRNLLLQLLRNVSGLGAIVAKLKALIEESRRTAKKVDGLNTAVVIKDYINLLDGILKDRDTLRTLHTTLLNAPRSLQQPLWQELVALIGGGRLLSVAAESQSVLGEVSKDVENATWIADGLKYSTWIGTNLAAWASQLSRARDDEPWEALSAVMRKSMRLGHPDVIQGALIDLSIGKQGVLNRLLNALPAYEQKSFISSAIRLLSKRYLSAEEPMRKFEWWKSDSTSVAAVAGFLQSIVNGNASRAELLSSWLTGLNASGVGEPVAVRRSVIAVVATNKHAMEQVLDKSMQQFGDQLYIKHTPSLQQDVHTQTLLLAAGCVQRSSPLKLKMLIRSSLYLNAVSNRLASSSSRARFLGMIVGEALSALAEPAGKQMDFKMEELQSDESKWYKSLVNVQDSVGAVADLKAMAINENPGAELSKSKVVPVSSRSKRKGSPSGKTSKVISIEELDDETGDEDEELMAYGKPDSDAEDSDDDPTLITRNKPTVPVYIRDLISYFRDAENYDKQRLALTTAPSLIRRKANFGTEVKDHVEELATLLMGLQDKYDIDNFNELRMQSSIAVLLSDPERMGKWYAKTFFDGDYSVSQRASVLSTITMAARELGGHQNEDKSPTAAQPSLEPAFPSQRLPTRLEAAWQPNAVDVLTEKMSKAMIQPLAAEVADQATGPNILKVRTFSSRLVVESRRAAPTVNNLAKIIADSFFFPLTGRFFAYLKAYGGKSVIFESYLLSSYVKTLSLLLHASGTNTLQLPQMTREFWDLLLALRSHTFGDRVVGEAVLFGFMTILELNQDQRRLAEQHGREMLETQKWVETWFGTLGEGSEEERSRTLAAGVLFRLREVVQKYQALLMGDLASF